MAREEAMNRQFLAESIDGSAHKIIFVLPGFESMGTTRENQPAMIDD
jgi:hypothetical protein